MTVRSGIVLFGHGARAPEWAAPMERARDRLRSQAAADEVELAFLEFMAPTLPEALDELAQRGIARIEVIPMFLAQGGHLKRDLPALLDEARARHPQLDIRLAPAVGEAESVIAAMADYAAERARMR
ncbi:MAG TPA: CbiX/SirB N-terminal domain-containing protein [Azoarcus taiwanensis]|uniref:Cobalamin biosynthesis protein CbiX n=1 Tax=Azoarcus taiwanensis TaxID=666964 RepID=A0A972F7R0_9RHOO|nr:CbiX/SirB N-terminal domain-containing protein [Azoarcus taiwanensis]NMG03267.1 cobalamin biosynthesis protein CbiX [Azoarcus taiwanensis]HRQ57945.1 CbiX/SirB N-terminal domain-containing protein [Azoarcus taiwanensis]